MSATLDLQSLRPPVVTIRTAKIRDLPALHDMITALVAEHGDKTASTLQQLERDLFGSVPWIHALVAEAAGELIGYAILCPLYRAAEGARGMELHHLFVRPAHRNTGIGHHLVEKARDHARRSGCAFLSVSAATGNFKAHKFYEHLSFKAGPVTGMRYMQTLA